MKWKYFELECKCFFLFLESQIELINQFRCCFLRYFNLRFFKPIIMISQLYSFPLHNDIFSLISQTTQWSHVNFQRKFHFLQWLVHCRDYFLAENQKNKKHKNKKKIIIKNSTLCRWQLPFDAHIRPKLCFRFHSSFSIFRHNIPRLPMEFGE